MSYTGNALPSTYFPPQNSPSYPPTPTQSSNSTYGLIGGGVGLSSQNPMYGASGGAGGSGQNPACQNPMPTVYDYEKEAESVIGKLNSNLIRQINLLKDLTDEQKEKMLESISKGTLSQDARMFSWETEKDTPFPNAFIKPFNMFLDLDRYPRNKQQIPIQIPAYRMDIPTEMLKAGLKVKKKLLEEINNELNSQIAEQVAKMVVDNMSQAYLGILNSMNTYTNGSYYDTVLTPSGSATTPVLATNTTTGSSQFSSWYTTVSSLIKEQLNKVEVVEGQPIEIKLPDGTILNVDEDGNFIINDSDAKIIYKSMRMKKGNEFINATDLIERFIAALGEKGVKQSELLNIPIEAFFTWLVAEAAKQDGDDVPDADVVNVLKQHQILMLPAPEKNETQLDMFSTLHILVNQPEREVISA